MKKKSFKKAAYLSKGKKYKSFLHQHFSLLMDDYFLSIKLCKQVKTSVISSRPHSQKLASWACPRYRGGRGQRETHSCHCAQTVVDVGSAGHGCFTWLETPPGGELQLFHMDFCCIL